VIRRLAIALAGLAVFAGAALAFWTAAGDGAGSAGSASVDPVTITAAATTQSLLPTGAATGDVDATIANPNPFAVRVPQLALDTTQGDAGFDDGGLCALSYATQDNGGAGWTIPANGSVTVALTNSMTMGAGAANSCQGQTFTVYLRAS